VKSMTKRRLVGLAICSGFVAHSYGHEPGASPTPTPAVYQNATAATYAGSAPNNGLKAPTGNPSPTKGTWPKASSRTVSPPSSGIVGPPAPNLVKAVASSQPKLQKLRADAVPPPTAVNAAASTQPKLLKAMASTSSEFVRPLPNSSGTKSPPAAASSPSGVSLPSPAPEPGVKLVVSVRDQKLAVLVNGKVYRAYKISTSRYGEGDNFGSWRTPLGHLQVATKIGSAAPAGAVFRRRQLTGEVLAANAPGRDPIISRIIWLRGTEEENKRAFQRCIYIHGTPQETFLGRKASYGCIRMRSSDVIEVFNWVGIGTDVAIVDEPIRQAVKDSAAGAMVARNDQKRGPERVGSPSEANR
jgi:L,D-transpeptidase catalytic domain